MKSLAQHLNEEFNPEKTLSQAIIEQTHTNEADAKPEPSKSILDLANIAPEKEEGE
jgi:hypothetical protein